MVSSESRRFDFGTTTLYKKVFHSNDERIEAQRLSMFMLIAIAIVTERLRILSLHAPSFFVKHLHAPTTLAKSLNSAVMARSVSGSS